MDLDFDFASAEQPRQKTPLSLSFFIYEMGIIVAISWERWGFRVMRQVKYSAQCLHSHGRSSKNVISFYPFLSLTECRRPISPQGGLEPALGGMESRGGIHKAHLEFHLWKSCPLLLPYIRRARVDSGNRNPEFWKERKEDRTGVCSALHIPLMALSLSVH